MWSSSWHFARITIYHWFCGCHQLDSGADRMNCRQFSAVQIGRSIVYAVAGRRSQGGWVGEQSLENEFPAKFIYWDPKNLQESPLYHGTRDFIIRNQINLETEANIGCTKRFYWIFSTWLESYKPSSTIYSAGTLFKHITHSHSRIVRPENPQTNNAYTLTQ